MGNEVSLHFLKILYLFEVFHNKESFFFKLTKSSSWHFGFVFMSIYGFYY